jgi:acetyl-CoA carboxylase beta subunit
MMDHGLVDMIVERKDIRNRLAEILDFLAPASAAQGRQK